MDEETYLNLLPIISSFIEQIPARGRHYVHTKDLQQPYNFWRLEDLRNILLSQISYLLLLWAK